MKPKYILWDFGGVFIDISKMKTWEAIVEKTQINSTIFKQFRKEHIETYRTTENTEDKIQKKFEEEYKFSSKESLDNILQQAFYKTTKIIKKNFSILDYTKNLGYINIVASDTIVPHKLAIIQQKGYAKFDKVFLSCDIGVSKFYDVQNNTTDFFDYILEKLDIRPKESIFFDDKKENIQIAKKVGIKTNQITDINNMPNQVIAFLDNIYDV